MKDRELQRAQEDFARDAEGAEVELDLLELFYRLVENAGKIIAAAVAGTLILALYSFVLATPEYEATCRIYVSSNRDSAVNLSDLQIGSYLTSDYQEVFDSWEIHEMVIQNLDLDYDYDEARKMLEISNPGDTRILDVTVTSPDPREAMEMANEYAEVARAYISLTMETSEPTVLSSALLPDEPVRPRKLFNLALGFALGALSMIAVLTVRFIADDRIRTSDDIWRYAGMTTLAVVPVNGAAEGSSAEIGGAKA